MSEKDLAELSESVSRTLQAKMKAQMLQIKAEMLQMRQEWREHADRIETAVYGHSSGRAIKDLQSRKKRKKA